MAVIWRTPPWHVRGTSTRYTAVLCLMAAHLGLTGGFLQDWCHMLNSGHFQRHTFAVSSAIQSNPAHVTPNKLNLQGRQSSETSDADDGDLSEPQDQEAPLVPNFILIDQGASSRPLPIASGPVVQIPVFPLSSAVPLPTDSVDLHLYEPRYLKLLDHVLESEHRLFGLVHTFGGEKASLQPGDVGLIAHLSEWTERPESEVLSKSLPPGGRPTVETHSIGVGRFYVERVVSTGVDDGASGPPFLVADVRPFHDFAPREVAGSATLAVLERRVWACVHDVNVLAEKLYCLGHQEEDVCSTEQDPMFLMSTFAPPSVAPPDTQSLRQRLSHQLERSLYTSHPTLQTGPLENHELEARRRELFSFAVVRSLDLEPKERQALLEGTDAIERLQRVHKGLTQSRNYMAARSALKDAF